MSKYIIFLIVSLFAVGCMPTAKTQWVSTIKVMPNEVPVSKSFLDTVKANWYYNTITKCYGINTGFKSYLGRVLYTSDQDTRKLNGQQFIDIFGQPDFITEDRQNEKKFVYTYIDFKMRAILGYYYGNSTPYIYSGLFLTGKISFAGEGDRDNNYDLYEKKFNFREIDSIYQAVTFGCKTEKELENLRNIKSKAAVRDYFFYNPQGQHYVLISGFPLPMLCDSKVEVVHLFGKPSKIEENGDLIYYLSSPNHYGLRNYLKWSPNANGSYFMADVNTY